MEGVFALDEEAHGSAGLAPYVTGVHCRPLGGGGPLGCILAELAIAMGCLTDVRKYTIGLKGLP